MGGSVVIGGVTADRQSNQTKDSKVPETQVFDQAVFIKNRNEKIKQMKTDAKGINTLAQEINTEIHKQDEKLDEMNKKLENEVVGGLKEANQDLEEAVKISESANKASTIGCIAVIIVLAIGAGVGVFMI